MPKEAPIVTLQNVGGQPIRKLNADGSLDYYFSKDAILELRPEGEKMTDRQKERMRERLHELEIREDVVRLPDRQPSKGEVESESSPED